MNRPSSSRTSKTDWSRIRAMSDRDVAISSEHPEASLKHIARGIARRGLKPVPPKASISLRQGMVRLLKILYRLKRIKRMKQLYLQMPGNPLQKI
jgi:hypothetical protein